jgi:dienelactone hydrolase
MYRVASLVSLSLLIVARAGLRADSLPDTKPLTQNGDSAAQMVAGMDRYLMRELAASREKRQTLWKLDLSSAEAYARSLEPHRAHLRHILGIVDVRAPAPKLEHISTTTDPVVAEAERFRVYAVRWPVLEGVDAEGLLLQPRGKRVACVVALPDADWTPEQIAGLVSGVPGAAQFARHLAENGCQVLVPTLVNRQDTWSGNPRYRMTNQPHREFVYRMAFEMGRHIIGYEVQKVLAAVDWFTQERQHPPVGVYGYGEGGLLALASAALDPRIEATVVSGSFGPREGVWQEPIYRNVFGLLREFGDAELTRLIAPRALVIECSQVPAVSGPPAPHDGRSGAAPGRLLPITVADAAEEVNRALKELRPADRSAIHLIANSDLPGSTPALRSFLRCLGSSEDLRMDGESPVDRRPDFQPAARQHRQFEQLCEFTQRLMRDGEPRRAEFWAKADSSSPERWAATCKAYRTAMWQDLIGKLPPPSLPPNPQTRQAYDEPRWKGYEVKLDLYPDVFAYGILLLPKDLKLDERRPVVVCQHGLEGRPQDVVNPRVRTPYYNSFGAQLADRGFIVYAPQNPYIGQDKFRVLQRKANPLGLSLFSFIVRQHERTLDWLAGLPFVDPEHIGFYGLSYGGKTAMRVPALLERYALSICAGDFNEWVRKNVSLDYNSSYMFSGEYEMYEFNLGNTFNYAEMAALIAPRPFMVERGHDDGVGVDEWVAYEYAKVRRLYARLGLPERTAIEFFPGGHMINGKGTFAFLEHYLRWPDPAHRTRQE